MHTGGLKRAPVVHRKAAALPGGSPRPGALGLSPRCRPRPGPSAAERGRQELAQWARRRRLEQPHGIGRVPPQVAGQSGEDRLGRHEQDPGAGHRRPASISRKTFSSLMALSPVATSWPSCSTRRRAPAGHELKPRAVPRDVDGGARGEAERIPERLGHHDAAEGVDGRSHRCDGTRGLQGIHDRAATDQDDGRCPGSSATESRGQATGVGPVSGGRVPMTRDCRR